MKKIKSVMTYLVVMSLFLSACYWISEFTTTASPNTSIHHASFYGLKAFDIDEPINNEETIMNAKFWGVPVL